MIENRHHRCTQNIRGKKRIMRHAEAIRYTVDIEKNFRIATFGDKIN